MISVIKRRDEIPNYETLNYEEPNTDKMISHCKILNRDKKQIIDTSNIQKKYKWQGSIPHFIRDINLNIKNDPKNIFKSRKDSCNNSMLSTQRVDLSPNCEKTHFIKSGDFSSMNQTRKSSTYQRITQAATATATTTGYILGELKNQADQKIDDRYILKQISVRNQAVKGTSIPHGRAVITESDDSRNKSIAVKYIVINDYFFKLIITQYQGVHNDVIGILSRKVPIQVETDKISLFLKNKDQRKCKSRQSTRQSTCPRENTFYPQPIYQDFIGNNSFYPSKQSEVQTSYPQQQERGQNKISLGQYEDIVSQITNQMKINKKQEQQTDNSFEQKQVYSSLQSSTQNQNNNNNINFLTSNNLSSHDSTPVQIKATPNLKKVFVNQQIRQSTDYGAPMNQNYISANGQAQKRQNTDMMNQRTPTYSQSDKKQFGNLQLTPQKQNSSNNQDNMFHRSRQNKMYEQQLQQMNNQPEMIVEHKQFKAKRSMSSQARRMDSNEKEDLMKQIQSIQNQKYKQYVQDSLNINKVFYQSFQSQKNYLTTAQSPQSYNSSPKSYHNNLENIEFIPEEPNPKKYDSYVINKYTISKRLKPIVKHREKNQKYGNISNVQVEWVNSEKKVTYY